LDLSVCVDYALDRRGMRMGFLVGKPKGNISQGRRRREDSIKTDLRDAEWGYGLDSSGLTVRSVPGSCEHGNGR
jgi:hypothetical protein